MLEKPKSLFLAFCMNDEASQLCKLLGWPLSKSIGLWGNVGGGYLLICFLLTLLLSAIPLVNTHLIFVHGYYVLWIYKDCQTKLCACLLFTLGSGPRLLCMLSSCRTGSDCRTEIKFQLPETWLVF